MTVEAIKEAIIELPDEARGIVLIALALAVTAACLLPVYRATRVDPVVALRSN